ncbi:peptidylprolyl isomerase [Ectothiorhodospira haloalkaliphila]|uniref:Peptidyl-prolyl cis-trans isomerase n=1 Tax=Ectothiorhodospira haloalkaliphila TaxID=421628 RepID=W8KEG7_9GAMM|nr:MULTISPECIES: peptidylprolyl isomerase [Ectothiorhodospira]AHK78129.1 peptidylprolyl isomerase [Ectothiorhodospira haloalkaliphila]MCG5494624.1 peptidylprolyl isomerase [Ectothiorhodospira variabilis]MCG5496144.1 peptidylprolyl isomerase [Ectothiorhodospira variabilis]MCG5503615.1 peptidylprolyl isomerase [Ectothiorhodospira variabilis]MCG5506670.1 peptidylprolyl isomerase [Ectothiorhodospira variabilis]
MQIGSNKVVSIDYKLTDDEGRVIDHSSDRGPLAYLHGAGNIIPGLETALEGKKQGDELNVRVEPAQAYGERDEQMIQTLNRSQFQGVDELEVGMQFHAGNQNGGVQVVTVVAIDGDDVTIDANHPLAGTTLNFDVTVREVREASPEELEHGHAHTDEGANDH